MVSIDLCQNKLLFERVEFLLEILIGTNDDLGLRTY
ncbi:hypothetical protein DFP75_101901 [Marinomonas alcarazii]|uniref:Uncharacterized protein n=1 Tax=Marinomonas alcarazii TaxID=491949 RepID=A0A318VMK9_9GAMM|nr:hypothetical protein DFP75_101901 [Marinomonas alcarazii]